jgi:hypothetical protein
VLVFMFFDHHGPSLARCAISGPGSTINNNRNALIAMIAAKVFNKPRRFQRMLGFKVPPVRLSVDKN